jgi:hypothetical protein
VSKQIRNDISNWSEDRLKQWCADSIMRYEIADVPTRYAYSALVTILLMLAGRILAETSDVSPELAGAEFAKIIALQRRRTHERSSRERREKGNP